MDISKIDPNFQVSENINRKDLTLYNARQKPFEVYGLLYEDGQFRRLPKDVAKSVSNAVFTLHTNTAGGRVRFQTDSPYIAIYAKFGAVCRAPHFALTGTTAFDLYEKRDGEDVYIRTFVPEYGMVDTLEGIQDFPSKKMRELTINFPLYSDVKELYIGLAADAAIESPTPYKIQKPVVYYGSSITQGGCASRPGTCYEAIISRRLNCDHINLGFSGVAKAEVAISEYIQKLDMSAFVFDYDNNAPTLEHLQNTHARMLFEVREANPTLPIVLASRPKIYLSEVEEKRWEVIKETYNQAIRQGDQNIYLINGKDLMAYAGNEGTVDGTHPTDFGFYSMAKVFGDCLEKIFSSKE